MNKPLPADKETERAILGTILLHNDLLDEVLPILKPEDFACSESQKILNAMMDLDHEGVKIDLIAVVNKLREMGELEKAGGPAAIARLTDSILLAANIEYYARIVRELSQRRKLYYFTAETSGQIFDLTFNTRELLEQAGKKFFEIVDGNPAAGYLSLKEILPSAIEKVETLYHAKGKISGIPTGYPQLDKFTDGFHNAEYIVIGARPSVGKSAIALNIASNMALRSKLKVGFFSLEMPAVSLMLRMFSGETGIDSHRIRKGNLDQGDFHKIIDTADAIYDTGLFINDTPNMKLLDLRSEARRLKSKEHIDILFIDYLTLIVPEDRSIPRHEQIAEISRSLKALAKELDIPIVVVSQLRRETEGKRPSIADLRESGSIEQDADVIILLHREKDLYDLDEEMENQERQKKNRITDVIIAKQRSGPTGKITLFFMPEFTKFYSLESSGSKESTDSIDRYTQDFGFFNKK